MKLALVTGGNQGLGYEFCKQLAVRGYGVLLTSRSSRKGMSAIKSLCSQGYGYDLYFYSLSVDDESQIERAANFVAQTYGKLDLLVNNAGANPKSAGFNFSQNMYLNDLDPEEFLSMVRVNALGPILMVKHFQPLLEKAESPKVLNVSSWMGSIANRNKGGNYSYCASKVALNMMTKLCAFDLRESNIILLCINPGSVRTRMGGRKAQFTPEESVSRMLSIVERATIEDSGKFYNWDSAIHQW